MQPEDKSMLSDFRTLHAQDVVDPSYGESFDEFEAFYQTLLSAFNPTGPVQLALAEEVIANLWRFRRIKRRHQAHAITNDHHVLLPLQRMARRLSHSARRSLAAFCRQAGIDAVDFDFGPTSQPKSPTESTSYPEEPAAAPHIRFLPPNPRAAQRSDP
jgi:hypothetical protein